MTTAEKLLRLAESLPEPMLMEVLDFAEFLNQRNRPIEEHRLTQERPLTGLMGGLESSQAFQDEPVVIQQRIRDAWD